MKKKSIFTIIVIGLYFFIAVCSQGEQIPSHEYIDKGKEQTTIDEYPNIEDKASNRTVELTPILLKLDKKRALKYREKLFCFYQPWLKYIVFPIILILWLIWELVIFWIKKLKRIYYDENTSCEEKKEKKYSYFSETRKIIHITIIGTLGVVSFLVGIFQPIFLILPFFTVFAFIFHLQYLRKKKFNGFLLIFNLILTIEIFAICFYTFGIINFLPFLFFLPALIFLFAIENIAITLNIIYETEKVKPRYFLLRLFAVIIISIGSLTGYSSYLNHSYPWARSENFNPNSIYIKTEIDSVDYYNNKAVDFYNNNNVEEAIINYKRTTSTRVIPSHYYGNMDRDEDDYGKLMFNRLEYNLEITDYNKGVAAFNIADL